MGLGDFDDALGIGTDQVWMQVPLCFRVLSHGCAQRIKIASIYGVARRLGGSP